MTSKCGQAPSAALIEIVTDHAISTMRRGTNHTSCSHSLSSADDSTSDDGSSVEFPVLRKAGSFPMVKAAVVPPRRPSRSSSLEREMEDSEEDEIDRQKFLQLLLGEEVVEEATTASSAAESQSNTKHTNANANANENRPKMKHNKSSSSAPPKFPSRVGSDNEQGNSPKAPSTPAVGRINRDATGRQRLSLPSAAFRPLVRPVRRRRRHKSFIQEMLSPGSEGSSKSLRLPPKLPSRSESERSLDGSSHAIPSSVFCSSAASTASISQKSTNTASTDAPKRPRRSLSPIDGESIRSLLGPISMENAFAAAEKDEQLCKMDFYPPPPPQPAKRKRNLPARANTFCDSYSTTKDKMNQLSMEDTTTDPWSKLDLPTACSSSSKLPRCTRVLPRRSRTLSSVVVKPTLRHSGSDSSSGVFMVGRCA